MAEAPRRRRSSKRRRAHEVYEAPRRRSSRRMHAARRGGDMGARVGQFALAVGAAGLGFVLADGIDRWLSTYDPSATGEKPKDKFTSDGAGTLANTLNVASSPGLMRIGAGIGMTAIPAIAAMYVEQPFVRASLEGAAIGAGVSLFKSLWNNFLMPMLVGKDTSTAALQKSFIARLYPAEVAASINLRQTDDAGAKRTPQMAVSSTGSGALSAPADVGPFALAASAGGDRLPTVQNVWGTGAQNIPGMPPGIANLPTAAEAMNMALSDGSGSIGSIFDTIAADVRRLMPHATPAQHGAEAARRMHHEMTLRCHVVPHAAPGVRDEAGVAEAPMGIAAPIPTGTVAAEPWQPDPNTIVGPGPQVRTTVGPQPPDTSCGCIADNNPFLGFVGDEPAETASASLS